MRSRVQRIIRAVWILWWLLLLAGWAIILATIPDELTGDPLLATQVTYLTAWLVVLVILFAWLSHRDDIGEPMRLERWLDAIIDDDDDVEQNGPRGYENRIVQQRIPNAERHPVHAVPMQQTDAEQAYSEPNYSEQDVARIIALILADVRAYNGSPSRYGTSRAIEKALGLKRGAGSDSAAWAPTSRLSSTA
jgi:hypothetical protein